MINCVPVMLPAELLEAAAVSPADASRDSARLLALELYRENGISLGRAAELYNMPVEAFLVFSGKRKVPIHYGLPDLEEDRATLERLSS